MKKKKTSVMDLKLAYLLDLIKNNPLLPILPMVNQEVVGDDCWGYWMGSWGSARIDKYLVHNGRLFFKDDDDPFDVLERVGYPRCVDDMTDREIDAAYDALPWRKAIIIYIDTPESPKEVQE